MNFTNVDNDRYDKEAIEWVFKTGLVKGYPDGTFRPDEPLTRGQFCLIEYREYQKGLKH